jgi:acetolactate decarboxylase
MLGNEKTGRRVLELPESLSAALEAESRRAGRDPEALALEALRRGLGLPGAERTVYLSAPVNALLEGIYRQSTSLAELKRQGDFGLGTFNDLDGELTLLDGVVYQIRGDGSVSTPDDQTRTPFACVSFFTPDTTEDFAAPNGSFDAREFEDLLLRLIPSENMLYCLRVDGEFETVKTRSVPRQESYRPLVEVTAEQPVFEFEDLRGTLVGFYAPAFMQSLVVPGVHLHFLSEDRTKGGHLLACRPRQARVGVQHAPRLTLGLPMTLDFLTASFTRPVEADLQKAER